MAVIRVMINWRKSAITVPGLGEKFPLQITLFYIGEEIGVVLLVLHTFQALLRLLVDYACDVSEKRRLEELCSKEGVEDYAAFVRAENVSLLDVLYTFTSCQPPVERLIGMLNYFDIYRQTPKCSQNLLELFSLCPFLNFFFMCIFCCFSLLLHCCLHLRQA